VSRRSSDQKDWQSPLVRASAAISKEDDADRLQLQALVQTLIRERLITKPFDFFLEMQYAALDISDHRIIGRVMQQSASNLLFEHLLPPFKIKNVIWFRHDSFLV
jgi:hypothetical protein